MRGDGQQEVVGSLMGRRPCRLYFCCPSPCGSAKPEVLPAFGLWRGRWVGVGWGSTLDISQRAEPLTHGLAVSCRLVLLLTQEAWRDEVRGAGVHLASPEWALGWLWLLHSLCRY